VRRVGATPHERTERAPQVERVVRHVDAGRVRPGFHRHSLTRRSDRSPLGAAVSHLSFSAVAQTRLSKKEQRDLRRLRREENRRKEQQRRFRQNLLVIGGSVLAAVIILVLVGLSIHHRGDHKTPATPTTVTPTTSATPTAAKTTPAASSPAANATATATK
jgi:hypothetical protein